MALDLSLAVDLEGGKTVNWELAPGLDLHCVLVIDVELHTEVNQESDWADY